MGIWYMVYMGVGLVIIGYWMYMVYRNEVEKDIINKDIDEIEVDEEEDDLFS